MALAGRKSEVNKNMCVNQAGDGWGDQSVLVIIRDNLTVSHVFCKGNRNQKGQAVMLEAQPGNSISAWAEKSRQAGP